MSLSYERVHHLNSQIILMIHLVMMLCITASVFLVSACASFKTNPAISIELELPKQWSADKFSATSDATSLINWWLRFGDPQLVKLEQMTLLSNTSINNASAALLKSRALRDLAAATLWPTLNGVTSAKRSKTGQTSTVNSLALGLDASWELDLFGKNRSGLSAAEATTRANIANLGDVKVSIAAEVAIDYIDLRSAQARLAIATRNLNSQLETLQITQWRAQAGLVTQLDVEQARVSTEQIRALIPALHSSIEQLSHAIAVLTAQPPIALLAELSTVKPVPQASNDLALNFPAETLRQRADVRTAENQVSANIALLIQVNATRLPSFTLSGSLGLSAVDAGSLTNGSSVINSLLANVAMPLFDAGAIRAKVRVQEAVLMQSRIAYQSTVLTALKEVEDNLVALRGDIERLKRLTFAAQAAENAAVMARQRYVSGLVDFQAVLETQRSLLSTQDSAASAAADVSTDHVRLYKSLGGGWIANDVSVKRVIQ